ncbi:MAG: phenylacetate--CoA ligase [Nitrospira sp.]|nr:phenylacetate--CoA ligase [Nitrospira sp.]
MLSPVLQNNSFYRSKLGTAGIKHANEIQTFDDYRRIPFTTKEELSNDQSLHLPYGTNLTFKRENYTRIHQTSGTTGQPLRCLDTEESWSWWARCWAMVYRAAGVSSRDRIFFAFSFGPFIGFWSAHEGARVIGAMSIPGGGMSSQQRVKAIFDNEVTVLVCTPTYALHLGEIAKEEGMDLANSSVKINIHAGEPGTSIPGTRKRIESIWKAKCYDHAGATEVGAWGFECLAQQGPHLNESEFICEVIDPVTGDRAQEGELVISNLGRVGMPVIRYRTGDRVKLNTDLCECGRTFHRLDGGVIGRVDGVIVIRGINVFPSAIENIVRQFPEVGEFTVDVSRNRELDEMELRMEVTTEDSEAIAAAVAREIRNALTLRVAVKIVPHGTLPRFDLKARRFNDYRQLSRPTSK